MENIITSNATAANGVVTEDHPDVGITLRLIAKMLVFLLGVPGNCLILRVYWTKTRKTSTDILIRALAWADLTVCFLTIPRIIVMLACENLNSFVCFIAEAVLVALSNAAIASSFSITAVIAVERYDCVCRPQKRIFNPARSKIAVLVAVLFAVAIHAGQVAFVICFRVSCSIPPSLQAHWYIDVIVKPVIFVIALVTICASYGKVYATIRKHVKVEPAQVPTTRDERRQSDRRVERHVNCSTRPTPPLQINELPTREYVDEAVTRFVNQPNTSSTTHTTSQQKKPNGACTAAQVVSFAHQDTSGPSQPNVIPVPKAIAASNDNTPSHGQSHPEQRHAPLRVGAAKLQRKTTRMLFITSVVFLLTWLPYLIFIIKQYLSLDGSFDKFDEIIAELSITLLINCVVNPLIYGIANRRFRKDCKEVIRKIKCFKRR
ncbi:cholecystokinin receptor-like [Patiria miniata]|uniref:G-protein coupled receptors family 1 profile domain-containing protein n=1 Tax=Patiria miniata TaxID=46514 RepID=A0A913Z4M8_PATMI|nr:cholecystokinin receptor-like [Patiria miniata]